MEIQKLQLKEGARNAKGLTVIIDVFRAFSVECYLVNNGAKAIYPVATVEEALEWKKIDSDVVLIGERHEKMCHGFNFGNSPTHIQNVDFTGKTIVHTTSSGTLGIDLATNADEIITGSFVNAKAIAQYIIKKKPARVSLVAMGYEGLRTTQEDDFCADYIENELCGLPSDFSKMVDIIRVGDGARLLDPRNEAHSPSTDFDLCLSLNRFSFVLKISKDDQHRRIVEKIEL
jgi:2-phosphosulfolactate phosphatase